MVRETHYRKIFVPWSAICNRDIARQTGSSPTKPVRAIREAAGLVGMEKLMWGSDYPRTITAITYRMSYDFVVKSNELSDEEKSLFLGGNAKAFYGFGALPVLPYIKNMSE